VGPMFSKRTKKIVQKIIYFAVNYLNNNLYDLKIKKNKFNKKITLPSLLFIIKYLKKIRILFLFE
jgi:hypothetical protein